MLVWRLVMSSSLLVNLRQLNCGGEMRSAGTGLRGVVGGKPGISKQWRRQRGRFWCGRGMVSGCSSSALLANGGVWNGTSYMKANNTEVKGLLILEVNLGPLAGVACASQGRRR